jgi:hypothetical protein
MYPLVAVEGEVELQDTAGRRSEGNGFPASVSYESVASSFRAFVEKLDGVPVDVKAHPGLLRHLCLISPGLVLPEHIYAHNLEEGCAMLRAAAETDEARQYSEFFVDWHRMSDARKTMDAKCFFFWKTRNGRWCWIFLGNFVGASETE